MPANTEVAVRVGGDDARQIIELLSVVGDDVGAEMVLGGRMRDAATLLALVPGTPEPSDAATTVLIDLPPRIAALYTMAQEHEVHVARLPVDLAGPVTVVVVEHDDDDGLF